MLPLILLIYTTIFQALFQVQLIFFRPPPTNGRSLEGSPGGVAETWDLFYIPYMYKPYSHKDFWPTVLLAIRTSSHLTNLKFLTSSLVANNSQQSDNCVWQRKIKSLLLLIAPKCCCSGTHWLLGKENFFVCCALIVPIFKVRTIWLLLQIALAPFSLFIAT